MNAKSASKKLGVLFRCEQYFNSAQLFKLYTGFIRPCLEYCSHIWGSSPYTSLLDRVESKAIRLISDPSLTSTLDPLSLCRKVASLSLFYRYHFGHCPDELAACIPPPMARPRSTRQATFAHNYCVELSNARINLFSDGFFPSTSRLWNSLPSAVFPASSKGRSITTLGTRWHNFFYYSFRYFIKLFYSLHYTSFLFSRDADSRKGTLCPFCVPIHKKKKKNDTSKESHSRVKDEYGPTVSRGEPRKHGTNCNGQGDSNGGSRLSAPETSLYSSGSQPFLCHLPTQLDIVYCLPLYSHTKMLFSY